MSYCPLFWVSEVIYKAHDTHYMFERHVPKLIVFAFMAVCASYCPQFWGSGAIYKANDTQYMFERHDQKLIFFAFLACLRGMTKNSSFLRFWPFHELLPIVLVFRGDLQGP
jgi:hypothetical protein